MRRGSNPVLPGPTHLQILFLSRADFASTQAIEGDFLLPAALLARHFMIGTRCCTSSEAMQSIDWYGLIAIGNALGIGQARR